MISLLKNQVINSKNKKKTWATKQYKGKPYIHFNNII